MTRLEYSTSALNVLRRFHGASVIIFVEGEDDRIFWHHVAKIAKVENAKIQDVGGAESLKAIANRIVQDDAKVVVALDSDYRPLIGNSIKHSRIIFSYGYSIENTLYCPSTINELAQKLSRTIVNYHHEIMKWYKDFCEKAEKLLPYDIANIKYDRGVRVLGDSCRPFMTSNHSPFLADHLIDNFLQQIREKFTSDEYDDCVGLIKNDKREVRWVIKGHFMTLGVINLLKKLVKQTRGKDISISTEFLYTATVDGCLTCGELVCEPTKKMVQSLSIAIATI